MHSNNRQPATDNSFLLRFVYVYDAYCGWCYGFSPVMRKLYDTYKDQFRFEVISGGMIRPEKPVHISKTGAYILQQIPRVEELTGVKFGSDYKWHLENPEQTDWYPDSVKPAIALIAFKSFYPERAVEFAADMQEALFKEGRDLTDDEAYRHLTERYHVNADAFYTRLRDKKYEEEARYEFALAKQLQADSFPCLYVQTGALKFVLIAKGYTDYDAIVSRIAETIKPPEGGL